MKSKNPWNINLFRPILFPPDLFIVYPTGGLQCWMNVIQFSQKVQSQPTARLSRKQPIDPYTLSNSRLTKTYLKLEYVKQNATTIWQLFSALWDPEWLVRIYSVRLSVESNFTFLRVWYAGSVKDGNSEKCSLFSY